MARPRRSEGTRQKLLDEGVRAFLEHGYHGTGLKEVLDRVQVPKGSFYNYFESKQEFAAESIRHYARGVAEQMAAARRGARDPVAGLRRYFRTLMADYEAHGCNGGCLVANLGGELEDAPLCREALADAFRSWRDAVGDALREGQERGLVRDDVPARELADLLVDSWEGAVIRMKIERSMEPVRQCVERLLDGYFRP